MSNLQNSSGTLNVLDTAEELSDEEWLLARRVVASPPFARSTLLTNFLLYVCDKKLRGREDEINEYRIGTQALGRPSNYHPGEDNIVRNYARILRKRLDEYFVEEGQLEPIRIVIPRGHYVPLFEHNPALASATRPREELLLAPSPVEVSAESLPSAKRRSTLRSWWLAAGGLVAAVVLAVAYTGLRMPRPTLEDLFWSQLFVASRPAFVVTGDSGLAMLENMTAHEIHLHQYVSGELEAQFPKIVVASAPEQSLGADRFANYTSTADLNFVVGLAKLPAYLSHPPKVLQARNLRLEDVKQGNVILVGGPRANPWVELFEPHSAFRLRFPPASTPPLQDERAVINKQPAPGELTEYDNAASEGSRKTFTIVSFMPSLDGLGYALLLQGQNIAGTEAAADFLLNHGTVAPVLRKALRPDGKIGSFELVLETTAIGANAPTAHVVAERYTGH